MFLFKYLNCLNPIVAPISLFLKFKVGYKKINLGDRSLYLLIIFYLKKVSNLSDIEYSSFKKDKHNILSIY